MSETAQRFGSQSRLRKDSRETGRMIIGRQIARVMVASSVSSVIYEHVDPHHVAGDQEHDTE